MWSRDLTFVDDAVPLALPRAATKDSVETFLPALPKGGTKDLEDWDSGVAQNQPANKHVAPQAYIHAEQQAPNGIAASSNASTAASTHAQAVTSGSPPTIPAEAVTSGSPPAIPAEVHGAGHSASATGAADARPKSTMPTNSAAEAERAEMALLCSNEDNEVRTSSKGSPAVSDHTPNGGNKAGYRKPQAFPYRSEMRQIRPRTNNHA